MKLNSIFAALLLGIFCLSSCDQDTLDEVGTGVQPGSDKIVVTSDSFDVAGSTIAMNTIYAKSIFGLLGKLSDPFYGTTEGGYICQYYPSEGFYLDYMVGNTVDSVQLKILYTTYIGDSIAPMEVSVYPVNKPLTPDYYTNVDPTQFCDMNTVLGKQVYTPRDMTITDSAYNATASGYYRALSINLPAELGNALLAEYKKPNHGAYSSPEAMAAFFPGTYLKSTFGTGSMLNIEKTAIYIYYQREYTTQDVNKEDSIYIGTGASMLTVTKEVVQQNHYTNSGDGSLLTPSADKMYLKTPAGVCAQLTIDVQQIMNKMANRKLSNVSLDIKAYPKEYTTDFNFEFPGLNTMNTLNTTRSKLLLIEKDSVQTFFEGQKTADNSSYYFSTFNTISYSYLYPNIANVVQRMINKALEEKKTPEPLQLLLIPVQVSYSVDQSSYYTTSYVDYATSNYLAPSAVSLKKGLGDLKIRVVASDVK
ncbi:MAG: DUF4270 domain-containing protein [Candidatus Symbiothrix sp.]|jgi:hypothetical protein|nr:DUF4270 domain-containing protein [Candidatus Symbiothrix sp.]